MREISELIQSLTRAIDSDDARRESSRACAEEAKRLSRSLPWVHRAGKLGSAWWHIFRDRHLVAGQAGTQFEQKLGIEQAVYFFVGACAYPTGIVALLWAPLADPAYAGTFTPYDTGGLKAYLVPESASTLWDDDAKTRHLAEHLGHSVDATQFVGPYLAAHFRSPITYVHARRKSQPDFTPYHGLVNGDGPDRRSWTVEVQVHADVDVSPDGLLLQEIWLDHHDLWDDLPDDFKGMARVSPDGVSLEVAVAERIAERITRAPR